MNLCTHTSPASQERKVVVAFVSGGQPLKKRTPSLMWLRLRRCPGFYTFGV